MDEKRKNIAKVGFIAKGVTYSIIGVLTLLTALNMGGTSAGKEKVFEWIKQQAFGQVLLIIMAIGLLCYAIWRFIQVFQDPENIGNNKKAKFKKLGFFIGGLSYITFAGIAVKTVIGAQSSGGEKSIVNYFNPTITSIIFVIIGVGLAVAAIVHLKKVLQKEILDDFAISDLQFFKTIKFFGYLGFTARALVFGLLAYFFFRAGMGNADKEIKGLSDAFSFLHSSNYGAFLLSFVAAGFLCFGLFNLSVARYKKFG